MRTLGFIASVIAVALVGGAVRPVLAQPDDTEPAIKPPPIEVSVGCDSSPETVTIRNNRTKPIKLRGISSTWQRRAGEPYRVKKTLKPGESVSYAFGAGKSKGARNLSGSFIFDNDEPSESVVVTSSKGRVKVSCDDGTNVLPEPVDVEPPEGPVAGSLPGEPVDALELLATLPVEPEISDGYDRALFPHWVDADGDGCDAREATMIAESLTPVTTTGRCDVEAGTWYSPFDGDVVTNPASIDVNHTVPLEEAWQSGARHWSPERREAYANDLLDERTLRAMSSGANRDQGEADPSEWLPVDHEVACQFVEDWVAIKASWGLAVDELEREAIAATLRGCEARMVTVVSR